MTRRRGGSNGAGVPIPRHANSSAHANAMLTPSAITIQPSGRGFSKALLPATQRGTNHVQIETKRMLTTIVRRTAKRRAVMKSTCYLRQQMSTVADLPLDHPIAHTDPVNAKILAVS